MTTDDLDHIERELGIKLPETYRRAMLSFPIPAYTGNDRRGDHRNCRAPFRGMKNSDVNATAPRRLVQQVHQ